MEDALFLKGVELFLGFKVSVYDAPGLYGMKARGTIICLHIIDDLLASAGRDYITIGKERGIDPLVVTSFGSFNE